MIRIVDRCNALQSLAGTGLDRRPRGWLFLSVELYIIGYSLHTLFMVLELGNGL